MNQRTPTLKKLESSLGYTFKDLKLLEQSVIHRSYAHEKHRETMKSNERLEYLGDAVLNLVISDLLMERFSNSTEGELSKIRASVVNEEQLAKLALELELGKCLLLGHGEELTLGRKKASILADAYEAVLAAIYLDGGFNEAYKVIDEHFSPLLAKALKEDFFKDFKTQLQEEMQKGYKKSPSYQVVKESGPEHHKVFEVQVQLPNQPPLVAFGSGRSKKEAEQDAARNALKLLKEEKEF